ncbi:MAG: hypothetical protein OXN27_12215 [Candidatus Poribacteria bacterium]|nr:hypothetical protein [Candidatus Poribacteria bacterium]
MLFAILSVITGIIGFVFIVGGIRHPSKYQKVLSENVSAAQVTQVYTEATHEIVVGIGVVSIAVLIAVIGIFFHVSKPLSPDTQSTDGPEN